MSSDELADFFSVPVSARTYLGRTGSGVDNFADSVTVHGQLTRKQTFVRNENNEQVPSAASFTADVVFADTLAPKSQVLIAGQTQPTVVITREVSNGGALITGIDKVKVFLQ